MLKKYILLFIIILLAFQPFENVNAALRTKARICAVKGSVQTGAVSGDGITCPLKQTMKQTECRLVNQATMIETGPDGWANIEYANGRKVRIMPNTKVVLQRDIIYVYSGSSWFKVEVRGGDQLHIKTPTAIAGIRGTEFVVNVEKDGSSNFQLIEGSIEISDANKKSNMMLAAGMEISIAKGSSTLNTALLKINENNKWWTDWPTLIPIANMPGSTATPNNNGSTFYPIADNHVYAYSYSNWNNANWGKYEQIGAGWNPTGGEKRAFLKFDLSNIDPNSFEKATLRLYHNHTGGGNAVELGVYAVEGPWTEGRGTYKPASAAQSGELTWNNQPKIAQYPTVYFNPGQGTNKWVEVDVTTLVKAWLNDFPNHGMAIKAGENYIGGSESQYGFYSREFKDADKRPQLVLNGTGGTTTSNNNGNITLPITDSQAQGTVRLLTANSNRDMVGPNETYSGNGKYDAIFRAQFKAPNRTVTAVEVSNTNGLRSVWDTRPNNRLWLGGVAVQDRIMSRSDGSVNFSLGSDQNTLDFFVEDNGSIRGGKTNYRMTIFFASGEPFIMDIVPANSSNTTVTGQWQIIQHNGYDGTLTLQQNQSGRITGTANWNQYDNGTINGQLSGNSIEFTISYASGDYGKYTGTVTQNGIKIANGFVKAKNGTTASWDASKAIIGSNQGTTQNNLNARPWVIGNYNGIHYGTGSGWKQQSGGGKGKDIAIDGNNRPWVIGTDNGIHYHNGSKWVEYPGGGRGLAIAIAPNGIPWVIGTNSHVFHGTGSGWVEQPGGGLGKDIAIDKQGRPWVIGTNNGIYYYEGRWIEYPGGGRGSKLAISPDGKPWVIGTDKDVYFHDGSRWTRQSGDKIIAKDIAVDDQNRPWVLKSDNRIFYQNSNNWVEYPGGGRGLAIAVSNYNKSSNNANNFSSGSNNLLLNGEWEMTCIGDIIYKFKLTLKQSGNGFYGDMVRTNGNEKLAKIEGEILPNDRIKFTRSIGNWKQYYTGEINQKSGSRATSFEGMFGFKDQLNNEWYAKAINNSTSNNSIAGEWLIDQSNGYNGSMTLQKGNSGRITGNAIWNGYLKGTIDGKVMGSTIEFTISYPNGDKGLYKGTLTQNGTRMINGTAKGNNGVVATWEANK